MRHLSWLRVLAAVLTLGWGGCVSADSVLRRIDYSSEEQRVDHAQWIARVVAGDDREPVIRAYGADALGNLRSATPEVIDALGGALVRGGSEELRNRAAWALGEIGRELPWNELGVRLHQQLVLAMSAPDLAPSTAYFICEAVGKEYVGKEHTQEEDIATVQGLNALAANQRQELPSAYYLVFEKVATIDVMIELVRRQMAPLADGSTQTELEQAYSAAFDLLRRLHDDSSVLLAGFEERRQLVSQAFDAAMAGLAPNIRTLTMMLVWYAGVIGDNAPMGELLAAYVTTLASHDDTCVRFLTAWSLARMQLHARSAREALRDQTLMNESDLDVLQVLCAMHLEHGSADLIQRAYAVEVAP